MAENEVVFVSLIEMDDGIPKLVLSASSGYAILVINENPEGSGSNIAENNKQQQQVQCYCWPVQ